MSEQEMDGVSSAIVGNPIDHVTALHWYDLICPFCYIGQSRNAIFEERGIAVADLAFEIHPEIPLEGKHIGPRTGEMYDRLRQEADEAGLPLNWPDRLPNSRMALAAAEWVRRYQPEAFRSFQRSLFAAHFADTEDIGSENVVRERARVARVNIDEMVTALGDKTAYNLVSETEMLGRNAGVHSTPSWLIDGRLIHGLHSRNIFAQIADAHLARHSQAGSA